MKKRFVNLLEDSIQSIQDDGLYELKNNEYSWIQDIILDYNKHGFCTYTSQPGKIETNVNITTYEGRVLSRGNIRKQRAYIRGFMRLKMANTIVDQLKDHEFLIARTTYNNNIIPDLDIKVGSVIFTIDPETQEETPLAKTMPDIRTPDLSNPRCSFNFDKQLTSTVFDVFPHLVNTYELDPDIVQFDLLDRRWNDNSILWTTLHSLILKYVNDK